MGVDLPSRAGVFVVRVWKEPDGLRARIIETVDVTRPESSVTRAAATREDVYEAVRVWLEAFLRL